jgi:predicted component of type VI protein secretion system
MEIKLVSAELKIRMNTKVSCEQLYKHILTDEHLLQQIRQNEKYQYYGTYWMSHVF